ncbi:MAG: hypothetical protein ACFB13_23065 [Kiloniellaceae bacterium]
MTRFATVHTFPTPAWSGPMSRAESDAAVERGRTLQGEALRSGFRRVFAALVGGCRLRVLRLPGRTGSQRQPSC